MIVPFHGQQRFPITPPKFCHPSRQLKRCKVSSQFCTLQSQGLFNDLCTRVVSFASSSCRVHPNEVVPPSCGGSQMTSRPLSCNCTATPAIDAALSIASNSKTHSPDERKHELASSAYSCPASPRSVIHCLRRHVICSSSRP